MRRQRVWVSQTRRDLERPLCAGKKATLATVVRRLRHGAAHPCTKLTARPAHPRGIIITRAQHEGHRSGGALVFGSKKPQLFAGQRPAVPPVVSLVVRWMRAPIRSDSRDEAKSDQSKVQVTRLPGIRGTPTAAAVLAALSLTSTFRN
ncbi:hypothetical protein MTO96_018500 [Rhipicephalus appendiculatus]